MDATRINILFSDSVPSIEQAEVVDGFLSEGLAVSSSNDRLIYESVGASPDHVIYEVITSPEVRALFGGSFRQNGSRDMEGN